MDKMNSDKSLVTESPFVGQWGMIAGSSEHLFYAGSKKRQNQNYLDFNAIIDTFVEQRAHSVDLEEDVVFETEKLKSGRFVASWKSKNNDYNFIFLNGLGTGATTLCFLGQYCVSHNANLYALDRAGSGLNSVDKPNILEWVKDIQEVSNINTGKKRNVLISQCFSTGLTAKAVYESQNLVDKVVYVTPSFHIFYQPSLKENLSIFLDFVKKKTRPHHNPVPLFAYLDDENMVKFLENDPLFTYGPTSQTLVYGKFLIKNAQKAMSKTRQGFDVILAKNDKVVDNTQTKKTIEQIKQKRKNLKRDSGSCINVHIIDCEHYIPLQPKKFEQFIEICTRGLENDK